ncbi:hypothetical protein IFM89_033473 [Coptis chinensis]|uniref:Pectinesterase inhibitor domain-containing protein n=1 Tax=Coptis chinensis TaxID=261450 RepID=A0A835HYV2_9MAGN|nr:hypothetical protein IFM89_033473 [Coptis chinensis]
MGRVLTAGISIIFVVGVIVGIVITVNRGSGNTSHQSNGGLSTGMKARHHKLKDLVKATFQAAQEEVTKAWGKSGALGKDTTTSFDKMLLDGYNELLLYPTHRLQAATSAVEHSNFDTMSDRVDDLKTWLSAVIALKTTCLDDLLEKPGLQKTMQDELMNATQITFNALAIVDEISQILSKVNSTEFPVKINQNSRRLLNAEVDKDGYPAWFSAVDRKLLAFKNTLETECSCSQGWKDGFIASSMGFENVAGLEGEQAVAFHSKSDFSALYNYRI